MGCWTTLCFVLCGAAILTIFCRRCDADLLSCFPCLPLLLVFTCCQGMVRGGVAEVSANLAVLRVISLEVVGIAVLLHMVL